MQGELQEAVHQSMRAGFKQQEAKQLGGRLSFACEAARGREGRAYTSAIINAKPQSCTPVREQPHVLCALEWWQETLPTPLARREPFKAKPTKSISKESMHHHTKIGLLFPINSPAQ